MFCMLKDPCKNIVLPTKEIKFALDKYLNVPAYLFT